MKKPKISFRAYGGSGPLSIHWYDSFGDAEEAIRGNGVCWYSPSGEILAVEFDDVEFSSDEQSLELRNGTTVHIKVKEGRVQVDMSQSSRKTGTSHRP